MIHVVLVHQPGRQDRSDFEEIARRIEDLAPDVKAFVVTNGQPNSVTRKHAGRNPTLVFSPGPIVGFRPLRGQCFAGRPMSKLEELTGLRDAGLPVPPFELLTRKTRLDPAVYGPLVVLKPEHQFASRSSGITLRRTGAVRYQDPSEYPPTHPGHHGPMIVQKFIDTGVNPREHRVLTLFGVPLYATSWNATAARPRLDAPDAVLAAGAISTGLGRWRNFAFVYDTDILDVAARAYHAMPDIPLQGCDIIRDVTTGEVYLLEINPGGNTWHFSSGGGASEAKIQRKSQFGAWDRAAQALIAKAREAAA
jgi:hypothetical protein